MLTNPNPYSFQRQEDSIRAILRAGNDNGTHGSAEKDLDYDPASPEEKLQVTTAEAAACLGIEEDHPALRRIRAMCGLDHLCVSTSGSDESGWNFRIDSDIWRFRDAQDLADLARIRQEWIDQGAAESARRRAGAAGLGDEADAAGPAERWPALVLISGSRTGSHPR